MLKKKLVNLRLAVFIAISLCIGIITAFFFKFESTTLGIVGVLVFIILCVIYFIIFYEKVNIKLNLLYILGFILFFLFGFSGFYGQTEKFINADLNNHFFEVSGKIIQIGETDTGVSATIDDVSVSGYVSKNLDYKVQVYIIGDKEIDIGDKITFNATLKDKSIKYENTFSPYDTANGIKYTASVHAENINVNGKSLNAFETCNVFIRDSLRKGLGYKEFTVAYAILTGDSELMDYNIISAYRYLGVAHIFAVSGLHIGFLATAFNFIFNKLKMKRIIKAFVITAILVFYSGICGFTASSIRATVMSAIMLFLSVKGERYDGLSAVSVAGIIVLLISPIQLFCVGFQLSFGVVIGILLLSKRIEFVLKKIFKRIPNKIASAIGVMLSAQLSGIPISLSHFGYFSPISIIANCILIPVIGILFCFLITCTLLGGLFSIEHITLFLFNYVFKFINFLLTSIDGKTLIISGITLGVFVTFFYAIMVLLSGILNLKNRTRILSICICVMIFIFGTGITNVLDNKYAKIYICGSETACVTVVSSDKNNIMIVSDIEKIYSLGNLRRLSSKNDIEKLNSVIILGGFEYDMQVFVSRLRQVFNLETIIYYGEKDEELEQVMSHSFNDLKVKALNANKSVALNGVNYKFLQDGIALDLMIKERRVVVVSTPDKPFNYDGIGEGMDILIAGHSLEQFAFRLNPDKLISYRAVSGYDNGESNGNYFLSFK